MLEATPARCIAALCRPMARARRSITAFAAKLEDGLHELPLDQAPEAVGKPLEIGVTVEPAVADAERGVRGRTGPGWPWVTLRNGGARNIAQADGLSARGNLEST